MQHTNKLIFLLGILYMTVTLSSCQGVFVSDKEKEVVARVGENFLYKEDLEDLVGKNVAKEDSITLVTSYINNWASKQLLMSKSKVNLSEDQLAEFDRLVANYKTDLYTGAYKEALVQKEQDTIISKEELEAFYQKEKENFKLSEKLLRVRYVELPPQFLNKKAVIDKLKGFSDKDRMYLDSINVQFRKVNFNDSVWVEASRLINEIPPLTSENEQLYLKKSQFFEMQDSLGVYLTKVVDMLDKNEAAPLQYITPTIKRVLLNRRRLEYLRKLEVDIIDEAIKNKEFEIYEKQE
ncbi:peptidyl-prolyl cis-trans isomerase [Cellulophaga sp. 20_2_10]|uniref:peptidyl-prolyl cis-trans isomerase n=1 Tax=Cellulophaga sp. 20_2_10 TaxID=2942476 RepID=UPI00201A84B0|nr:peptidyl-prolyl cis-trans isomerase [Cellulophaga sp. 20_2_10]MCL5246984.1 peptidyl-prolyl cis-trans isomerase [Cellulophaga sp. 20_2_10]